LDGVFVSLNHLTTTTSPQSFFNLIILFNQTNQKINKQINELKGTSTSKKKKKRKKKPQKKKKKKNELKGTSNTKKKK